MICVQTVNYSFAAKEVSISRIQNYKGTVTKTVLELELETMVRKDFTFTITLSRNEIGLPVQRSYITNGRL